MKPDRAALLQVISELLFVLLPIIVVQILLSIDSNHSGIVRRTELSFVAIVLFGQSVVKFTAGVSKNKRRMHWQIIAVVTSGIIVLGLVPSATFLISILREPAVPVWVLVSQVVWFGVALVTYVLIGTVGQMYIDQSE